MRNYARLLLGSALESWTMRKIIDQSKGGLSTQRGHYCVVELPNGQTYKVEATLLDSKLEVTNTGMIREKELFYSDFLKGLDNE